MIPLVKQEMKNYLGIPQRFQAIDFLGVIMGAIFFMDAYRRIIKRKPLNPFLPLSLGVVMIWIHSTRFFYAPQTRQQLDKLLLDLQ
jgi:hypothetical protein